ncbi:MAG TPA: general secretion pathway protein GspB [Povalibacter sp.]
MSFILDALKKSENERQRTVGPSLADAPTRQYQPERPWWVVAVAALLVINLGVLAIVLTRNKGDEQSQPAAPPPAAAPARSEMPVPATTTPAAQQRSTGDPAVRSLAEEAGVPADPYYEGDPNAAFPEEMPAEHPELAAAANVPAGPPIVQPVSPPAVAPLSSRAAQEARNAAIANDEILPTAMSLAASGTSLPEMRLDIHVYSNTPSERFVFINMRKYTEGQTLSEGPRLERVTPDGAVLNQQGLRFLLPRP